MAGGRALPRRGRDAARVLPVRSGGGRPVCAHRHRDSASEALTALLRTAPVRARVTALCDSAGEPCDGGAPDVWGFLAEYRCGDPLSGAVRAAIDGAAARGCASPEALTARAE